MFGLCLLWINLKAALTSERERNDRKKRRITRLVKQKLDKKKDAMTIEKSGYRPGPRNSRSAHRRGRIVQRPNLLLS